MRSVDITRRLEFDAGHRLIGHESKCAHLHGHRYVVEIVVTAAVLDGVGRIIDFSKIKELVGWWIDENWDHNMILNSKDVLGYPEFERVVGTRRPFLMDCNPTAENMVAYLAKVSTDLLCPYGILVKSLRLYETPNCWADFHFEE